jgi:hypothetical protein
MTELYDHRGRLFDLGPSYESAAAMERMARFEDDDNRTWRARFGQHHREVIEAHYLRGMVDLLRDEEGWTRIGADSWRRMAVPEAQRRDVVLRARQYARFDPLTIRTLAHFRDFAFSRGFMLSAKEDAPGTAGDDAEAFWTARGNRFLFSDQGQRKSSDLLLIDGEVFFVIFGEGAEALVSPLQTFEIAEILSNPDNAAEPWWYIRKSLTADGSEKAVAYPSVWNWPINPDSQDLLEGKDATLVESTDGQPAPRIYHARINTLSARGNSYFTGALQWAKQFRKFMESRVAIQQAIAMYPWQETIKGGAADVNARVAALQSSLVTADTEVNPPDASGSTWVQNEAAERKPVPQETGAAAARTDGTMILAIYGAAVGIFPHYFGVDTLAKMATADAMELPMLRLFQSHQRLWTQIYGELVGWAVAPDEPPESISEFDTPPITDEGVREFIDPSVKLGERVPSLQGNADYLKRQLTALGYKHPQAIIDAIGGEEGEIEVAKKQAPPPMLPPPGEPKEPVEESGRLTRHEALAVLIDLAEQARRDTEGTAQIEDVGDGVNG